MQFEGIKSDIDVAKSIATTAPWTNSAANPVDRWLDTHVVIINNYLRPHHVASYRELAKRVRKLTILLSVAMEPDREWLAQWDELDVRLQKNYMFISRWKHSAGFKEPNFIHLPLDTASQLKQLQPDIVFSYEMGVRTLLAGWYRRRNRHVPLVMVGNMSERIENERGFVRRQLRGVIRRAVDAFTYNGPSCQRYLRGLSIPDEKLFHLPYCIDLNGISSDHMISPQPGLRRLLYCGAISERKGVVQFATALRQWCAANPDQKIEFSLAGSGALAEQVVAQQRSNLSIHLLGNCNVSQMKAAYQNSDLCVFPSLADEWGLVPIEAMASGVPVLGSVLAQSVETCIADGVNGWSYDPLSAEQTQAALDRALKCSVDRLIEIGNVSRQSVAHITPTATANCFCQIIHRLAVKP